jgi:hypothetical protein
MGELCEARQDQHSKQLQGAWGVLLTKLVWPANECTHLPAAMSHNATVLSCDPLICTGDRGSNCELNHRW